MSVDYNGEFGIGYEVTEGDELIDSEETEDGFGDYLYECDGEVATHFCTGSDYNGELQYYLVLKDPFKDGLDLTKSKERLDAELVRLKVEPVGEFGSVGGLYVW